MKKEANNLVRLIFFARALLLNQSVHCVCVLLLMENCVAIVAVVNPLLYSKINVEKRNHWVTRFTSIMHRREM